MTLQEAIQIFETITPEQLEAVGTVTAIAAPIWVVVFWATIEGITRMIKGITNYINDKRLEKQLGAITKQTKTKLDLE